LEWGPKSITWPITEAWLKRTLEGSDATPWSSEPGTLTMELSKQGKEIIARGNARVKVSMACVVTLDPIEIELNPEIFLMLAPGESADGRGGHGSKRKSAAKGAPDKPGASDKPKEKSKSAKSDKNWTEDPELTDREAAQDTYEGSEVVLDSFVREFILLELPMYPRRSDLPADAALATAPPSADSGEEKPPIDPRLLPLAAIASRLREKKE
jgi:uncharacterized metal-binding protein YceD (DUF177 family)